MKHRISVLAAVGIAVLTVPALAQYMQLPPQPTMQIPVQQQQYQQYPQQQYQAPSAPVQQQYTFGGQQQRTQQAPPQQQYQPQPAYQQPQYPQQGYPQQQQQPYQGQQQGYQPAPQPPPASQPQGQILQAPQSMPSQAQQQNTAAGIREYYGAPRYEPCTKVITETPILPGQCSKVVLTHACESERYVILCRHTAEGQNCQISDTPIPPNTTLEYTICVPTNFLMRHAACKTLEGCDAFAQRRSAQR